MGMSTDVGGSVTPVGSSNVAANSGGADVTVVTAGANVNGVIVRFASVLVSTGPGTAVRLRMGASTFFVGAIGGGGTTVVRDIFIPPGESFVLARAGAATFTYVVNYEIL